MKVTSRFTVRAALALAAAGVVGAFGACKDNAGPTPPPPVPPPPPAALPAPTGLTATPVSATRINLAWAETATNETGFRIDRCAGAACTNFAQIGTGEVNAVAFADSVGLTASTAYSYRVRAFNATDTSAWTATVTATTLAATAPGFVMVGAGEITSCNVGKSSQTATLIDNVITAHPDAIVFTAGSNVSDSTAGALYATCFDNSGWAKFLPRMKAAVGQRDFQIGSANGSNGNGVTQVYNYLSATPDKAGAPDGWYSFDVGTKWRVFVLNTSTWQHGAVMLTDPTSRQNTWLATQLAATTQPCVMAIVNLRRFYSYGDGANLNVRPIWSALYNAGADVVISATDKAYERWAPQAHDGTRDDARGIRQFIVGTGGRTLDAFPVRPMTEVPNLEVRDRSVHGVLKLTLNDNSYSWEFIPVVTGGFTDTGTANCH